MSSIDCKELFEQYYQNEYDFNTESLSVEEIEEIKKLAREKRVDYALAPMGTGVFSWILNQDSRIRFEMIGFDSDKVDGMLYIPAMGQERAYIILNENKPLINQIFTAAHEYYHYIKDYQRFKENPYICDFGMLKDVNEKCASRFAAELLLPEEALKREIKDYLRAARMASARQMEFGHYATLIIVLTIKYQMPLKSVIYRLAEEHVIDNVEKYIENYDFIKKVLQGIKIFEKQVSELYGAENHHVVPYRSVYQDMEKSFLSGNASREDILEDAEKLNLDMDIVRDFLVEDYTEDDEIDDKVLFSFIEKKRG